MDIFPTIKQHTVQIRQTKMKRKFWYPSWITCWHYEEHSHIFSSYSPFCFYLQYRYPKWWMECYFGIEHWVNAHKTGPPYLDSMKTEMSNCITKLTSITNWLKYGENEQFVCSSYISARRWFSVRCSVFILEYTVHCSLIKIHRHQFYEALCATTQRASRNDRPVSFPIA